MRPHWHADGSGIARRTHGTGTFTRRLLAVCFSLLLVTSGLAVFVTAVPTTATAGEGAPPLPELFTPPASTDGKPEATPLDPAVEFDPWTKLERRDFPGLADGPFNGDPLTWADAMHHDDTTAHDHGGGGVYEVLANSSVCPAAAPTTSFDVVAMHVEIPLNRFGSHDPEGRMYTLAENVDAVRAQARLSNANPDKVSIGLRDDPIQPLVVRANLGDCVVMHFENDLRGEPASIHVHRGPIGPENDGSFVGENADTLVRPGDTRTYTFYVPSDDRYEGVWYFHSHGLPRVQTSHGLFGALVVEHAGSTYYAPDPDPETGELVPIRSGWEAIIDDGETGIAYREYVIIYHEIGNEKFRPNTGDGNKHPLVDGITGAYRPCAFALNYRSECFSERLGLLPELDPERRGSDFDKSLPYSSYAFGDPATPLPRAYAGDPSKAIALHAGSEQFHSHHQHGGGIRWRFEPHADSHAGHDLINRGVTKLDDFKRFDDVNAESRRLDAQSIGPGEGFTIEFACGAGGCQRAVGDLLFHCHVPEHYVAGMWGFWRTYNTLQPDLAELPGREGNMHPAVSSTDLLGTALPSGTVLDESNVEDWVESNLPPQGVPRGYDATVFDWVKVETPEGMLYLTEPEGDHSWENFDVDEFVEQQREAGLLVEVDGVERRVMLFDPNTGRLAWPMLSPHLGARPPYAPGAHGPAPYLTSPVPESQLPTNVDGPQFAPEDPNRMTDALCPPGSPIRVFNIVALEAPVDFNGEDGMADAMVYVLADEAEAVRAGEVNPSPLVYRANVGDCLRLTLVSELRDSPENHEFSKTNIHPHFVQFDTQGSDGVSTGYSFEQAVRPYRGENRVLGANASAGDRTIHVANRFDVPGADPTEDLHDGVWLAVGQGTNELELHQIESFDAENGTITFVAPLSRDHPEGVAVGTEFVQYSYYLDTNLGTVYFHDHVDAILHWPRGLFGTLLIEPEDATYHHPETGEPLRSGPVAAIYTNQSEVAGEPGVSFREIVLQFTDAPDKAALDGDVAGTVNLRAEPFDQRLAANPAPEYVLSSAVHGDPSTTLIRAYEGDPVFIHVQNAGTWGRFPIRVTGHAFTLEHTGGDIKQDSIQVDFAERYDLWLEGGAGSAGDYLWYNPQADHFEDGMWGIMRVHDRLQPDLVPLPDRSPPPGGDGFPYVGPPTGDPATARPPEVNGLGTACPADAPVRTFDVEAIEVKVEVNEETETNMQIFVLDDESAAATVRGNAQPLVLRAVAGECLEITLENELDSPVSMHIGRVVADPQASLGITVGYNPDQSVAPDEERTIRVYAPEVMTGVILDFAQLDNTVEGQASGLYGALVVAPEGARFFDPRTGEEVTAGTTVVVVTPTETYRDTVLSFHEEDPLIAGPIMPYAIKVKGDTLVNYRAEPLEGDRNVDSPGAFSSRLHGDPGTPLIEAYPGDPVSIRLVQGYGHQNSVFTLHGHAWPRDPGVNRTSYISVEKFWPHGVINLHLVGGAGEPGDYLWANHRMPYMEAGQWGLFRVHGERSDFLTLAEIEAIAAGPPDDNGDNGDNDNGDNDNGDNDNGEDNGDGNDDDNGDDDRDDNRDGKDNGDRDGKDNGDRDGKDNGDDDGTEPPESPGGDATERLAPTASRTSLVDGLAGVAESVLRLLPGPFHPVWLPE